MVEKECTVCGVSKPFTREFFSPDKRRKGGFNTQCKVCRLVVSTRWKKSHPEVMKKNYRRQHLKRNYGITLEEYDRMYFEQGGVCLTCGKPETAKNQYGLRRLAVDHDHKTGRVRGLLCTCCNRLIGLARDDVNTLKRIINYLEK